MARRKDVAPIEETIEETTTTTSENGDKPRKKRGGVYVPLNEFGQLDTARLRDAQREGIEQARIALGATGGGSSTAVEGSVGLITEEHMKIVLKYYGYLPANTIPSLINPKLRVAGRPEISSDMALSSYMLTSEQIESMAPDGAQFFNQLIEGLPQWVKDLIFSVGPGAKFFGQLAIITAMQTKAMLDAYKIQNPIEAQPESETRPN